VLLDPRFPADGQWRRPGKKVNRIARAARTLVRLGVSLDFKIKHAIKHAISRKSYWRLSRTPAMRFAMNSKSLHEKLGRLSLKQLWCDRAPLPGTA